MCVVVRVLARCHDRLGQGRMRQVCGCVHGCVIVRVCVTEKRIGMWGCTSVVDWGWRWKKGHGVGNARKA